MEQHQTLTLIVEKGPRKGETIACSARGHIRIGRVIKGNTFTIKDASISQRHISVDLVGDGSGWTITDLDTSNGTILNGDQISPLSPSVLKDGDLIKIGADTSILVKIGDAGSDSAPKDAQVASKGGGRPRRYQTRRGGVEVGVDDKVVEESKEVGGAGRRTRLKKAAVAASAVVDAAPLQTETEMLGPKSCFEQESCRGLMKRTLPARRGRGAVKVAATASTKNSELETAEDNLDGNEEKEEPGAVRECDHGAQLLNIEKLHIDSTVEVSPFEEDRLKQHLVSEQIDRIPKGRVPKGKIKTDKDAVGCSSSLKFGSLGGGEEVARGEEKIDMENMTLGQWLDRMGKCLPMMINDAAEEIIAELRERAARFNEHVAKSSTALR